MGDFWQQNISVLNRVAAGGVALLLLLSLLCVLIVLWRVVAGLVRRTSRLPEPDFVQREAETLDGKRPPPLFPVE